MKKWDCLKAAQMCFQRTKNCELHFVLRFSAGAFKALLAYLSLFEKSQPAELATAKVEVEAK
jgi:hypothetical protein